MPKRRSIPDALNKKIRQLAARPSDGVLGTSTTIASWGSAEAVDANLSVIYFPGNSQIRFVPKLAHVTGLSSGDPILVAVGPSHSYLIVGKVVGDASLASSTTSTDKTAPTTPGTPTVGSPTTSTLSLSWTASTDDTAVTAYDIYSSAGAYLATTTTNSGVVSNLLPGTSYGFMVRARDAAGNISSFSGVGTGSTSALGAGSFYTFTYPAIWTAAYNNDGHGELDSFFGSQAPQGKGVAGNLKSQLGFNYSQIISDATGGTAVNAWITLTFAAWGLAPGTAVLGTHSNTSAPAVFSTGSNPDRLRSASWATGERRQVALGVTLASEFMAGTSTGITLGVPALPDASSFYGIAYGSGTGANQPILTIEFTR